MFLEFSDTKYLSNAYLTQLTNFLSKAPKGNKESIITFRNTIEISIGSNILAKSFGFKRTIKLL